MALSVHFKSFAEAIEFEYEDHVPSRTMKRALSVAGTAYASSASVESPRTPRTPSWADLDDEDEDNDSVTWSAMGRTSTMASSMTMASARSERTEASELPRLLGADRMPALHTWKVKNTFIVCEGADDEDDDEELAGMLAVRKVKTEPSARQALFAELLVEQEQLAAKQAPRPHPFIKPLDVRQPEMSVGSVGHISSVCRPCAWFWREQGCSNGEECRHCHLCSAGEMKKRRKANRQPAKPKRRSA